MTLRDRISLTWRYGKAQLLIGAVYNLVCMSFFLNGISYTFFVDCFIVKVVVTAIVMYMASKFRDRAKDHGIIITDHNYDAISTLADNLFVIADGYTNQVRSREDLVRHGYLSTEDPYRLTDNVFPPAVPAALDGKNDLVKTLNDLNP